jgi:hypothetical protein
MKVLNTINFEFVLNGQRHQYTFKIEKEAKKEDAAPIGIVMQKWITNTLEELL